MANKNTKKNNEIKEVPLMFVCGGRITSKEMTVWTVKNGKKITKKYK